MVFHIKLVNQKLCNGLKKGDTVERNSRYPLKYT